MAFALWFAMAPSQAFGESAAQTPRVRVGVLKFGTVNWELDVVQTHGLAAKEGIELEVVPLGSKQATAVSLQGGAVDVIVTDWIWVNRQRAVGRHYTFVPYSLAVGALMVNPSAQIRSIEDLRGRRLGIAGGPVDKSWLLLKAYAKRTFDMDMKKAVKPTYAAPPLLNKFVLRDELPAALNFWHYGARLEAAGMQRLTSISEILSGLDVKVPVPMLGWVFHEDWAQANAPALRGFLRASYAAKGLLVRSDEEWQRLRPLLKVDTDATATALRDAYRAGVPGGFGQPERAAAEQVFGVLVREGGAELVGPSAALSPGTFWNGFRIPQ